MTRPVFGATVPAPSNYARLVPIGGGFAFESSYHWLLVNDLKHEIPADARKWDKDRKRWLISAQYANVAADLVRKYLFIDLNIPLAPKSSTVETRLLKVDYIGRCKERGDTSSAFGSVDGEWSVVFPEGVLRSWFNDEIEEDKPTTPTEQRTLYSVLALKPTATADEIKQAHRRLAKLWHPDVSHEPDAGEQFKAIQNAYEILSDPVKRKKYAAGLAFETLARQAEIDQAECWHAPVYVDRSGYRSPIRSGWILADGVETIGRFHVAAVLEWQDIVNEQGQTMIASWPAGAETFEVVWR